MGLISGQFGCVHEDSDMKKIRNHLLGLDQGEVVLFSDFEHDGEMWTGEGPRKTVELVTFSEPFVNPPMVQVHLSMWDMSNSTNMRVDVQAVDVTGTQFNILFRTWGDSKIARVRVAWTAIGELPHEEDWALY